MVDPAVGNRQFYQPRQLPSGIVLARRIAGSPNDAFKKHPADRRPSGLFAHGIDSAALDSATVATASLRTGVRN